MTRSPVFDGVDPALLALIQRVSVNYPQYLTNITSGFRQGDPRFHGKGRALDVELRDPKTNRALNNYQDPTTAAAYQQFANAVYAAADPAMQAKLRWGGYFGGGKDTYGALDLMHFDTGGDTTPMAGGSWAGGFNDAQAKTWGMSAGGGIGGEQQGPAMPKTLYNYTPEQRRKAIASIESAGSGDYGALGPEITRKSGAGPGPRDRAYGRYQIMGSNIPAWSKEVLGREITADEFMADPRLQDAIFDKKFGDYVAKYGESGAASMWFTGRPQRSDVKDVLGTSGNSYVDKYLAALGGPMDAKDNPNYTAPAAGGGPAVAGAGAPGAPAPEPVNPVQAGLSSMTDSIGGMFGAGTGSSTSAVVPTPKPVATPTLGQPANTFDPGAGEAQRMRLAQAMQRLNTGKLWV